MRSGPVTARVPGAPPARRVSGPGCCFAAAAAAGFFLAARAVFGTPALPVINTNNVVNVTNAAYGAVGDDVTDNTAAIQAAINAAAKGPATNGASGGTVEIPSAANAYLCGPLHLSNSINLQIDAGAILRMLPLSQYPGGTTSGATFLSGSRLHDIEISGGGAIDGQGAAWWPYANTNGANRAVMFSPSDCNRVLVQNVTLSNSPMFHIAISGSSSGNVTVQGVTVSAPGNSPNTDACDVAGTNILVQNCNIGVGDDDFTCGGGTSGVLLTNNTYGTGHGISIGSYTDDGGVSNITVINCTMNGTVNGIRIKSDNDRGGLVQNIAYYNIGMTNVNFPIQAYGYYDEVGTPNNISPATAASETVAAVTSTTPIYRNITFSNINATANSGYPAVILWPRTEMPGTNLVFDRVSISASESVEIYNVSGAQFIDCQFTLPSSVKTFELFDAQVVVTNSAPASALLTFDGLTTNGYGNGLALDNALAALSNTNVFAGGPLSLSASTLTVSNNLALSGSTLNYVLGTNAATIVVRSNLALGGTVNLAAGAGFAAGTYTLLTCGQSLSGSLPVLGSVPAGYNFSLTTNTAGQVNLAVTSTNTVPPAAPANLVATAGNALVTLAWWPSPTAASYNVKRSTTNGGPYPFVVSTSNTNYADAQVTNGITYYYVVSGVNSGGEGSNSVQVSATPQVPQTNLVAVNLFNDTFASSTLNSSTLGAPSATTTTYEVMSSKSWSPSPSLAAGHLEFGIGTTSSGCIEVQALFTNAPVSLSTVGDSLSLIVTFTNTSGLLTQSGALGFGLYNSGKNYPVPGGLNGTATTNSSADATGYAQPWVGYVGQLAYTGSSSQIMTRSPQTGADNNNQDAVTSGSTSSSYQNPAASTVGSASSVPSLTLVAGNPYTEVLAITSTGSNVLAITNSLYAGVNTNGALLSQFGAVASGSAYLTNNFDALAVGWRATGNTSATAIDINSIAVNAVLNLPGSTVSRTPTNLLVQVSGDELLLSWPSDHLGWQLQIQTNSFGSGLGTNWVTVPNSSNVYSTNVVVDPANGSVFLRLFYP
jgi:polygalacturonase